MSSINVALHFYTLLQVDASVCTEIATMTEPDCMGPMDPGSSVVLEGIVWHETENGKWWRFITRPICTCGNYACIYLLIMKTTLTNLDLALSTSPLFLTRAALCSLPSQPTATTPSLLPFPSPSPVVAAPRFPFHFCIIYLAQERGGVGAEKGNGAFMLHLIRETSDYAACHD